MTATLQEWQAWRASLPQLPPVVAESRSRELLKDALTLLQEGRCALCLVPGLVLVLDHDHGTGLARGMACQPCNTREGSCAPGADPVIDAYRAAPPVATAWPWSPPQPPRPARPRRAGAPQGPARVPFTIRILAANDERLTAAVEATGQSPQYVVDAALSAYFDALGIIREGGARR